MPQYVKKPAVFEMVQYVTPEVADIQTWLDAFDPTEFARANFAQVVAVPWDYYDADANIQVGCHIQAYGESGILLHEAYLKDGELALWETKDGSGFLMLQADEFDRFQPVV